MCGSSLSGARARHYFFKLIHGGCKIVFWIKNSNGSKHWKRGSLDGHLQMKASQPWCLGIGDMQTMSAHRHRHPSKRPLWIIVLISLVCVSLIGAYVYPPRRYSACYFFASSVCSPFKDWLPPVPARELTDEEVAARTVFKDILSRPTVQSNNPKIAFLFLTSGTLPFERLWEKFFLGHEDRFSIYVHASREKPVHASSLFTDRDIRSKKVIWGKISMVDAEKRLLANALQDADNQHFVLLSDSCVPLHNFDFVYSYLMETNVSFIDCFEDPGPHGAGRYSEHMMPEIEKEDWRKGSQWFSMKRQHALIVLADNLYYTKFKLYCKPGLEGRNCYADEHYLPTLFHMIDPLGIANWSVTHVDWSEGKWHPKAYRAQDATYELLKNITSIDENVHVTSDEKYETNMNRTSFTFCQQKMVQQRRCLWNEMQRPCYLFARKFYPEALDNLMLLFSNYTVI
ncbi:hypothetical protein Taro_028263 [Colocasia esculenta]|uniref:Core-2/I-branching beta-1,6-N-acetylglucosaminyltransferase family protein n=1 Tax=Colocasia esculenta TaxID=4460 RepID=A0A843VGT2_COLES|nr:hypothetical protein [Colocasia esculenta]